MATFTALYDACVLYSMSVTDLLMRLAKTDLFRARWTDDIHEEWIRSLLRDKPHLKRASLERRRDLMNENVLDCLVTGYEPLIDGLQLPDEGDRHVLAAAIRTRAHVIVTYNLKDFPPDVLAPLGIEAQHPDLFISHLLDLSPGVVCSAVKEQRESLHNPPFSVDELLASFLRNSLPETVSRLTEFATLL